MVYCQVERCPYYDNNFCTRKIVGVDPAGRCDYLYINGMLRKNFDAIDQSYKKEVNGNSIVMKQQKVGFFTEDYKYRKKLYGEVVGIKVTNLKTILNELGYNHSTVVRAWAEKGYILKDPAGKTSINIKNIGRTVIIKMIKYKELTGQPLEQPQEHRILEFRNKIENEINKIEYVFEVFLFTLKTRILNV